MPNTNALGRHVLVEFYRCSGEVLNDVPHIEKSMLNAAEESGAMIINSVFHHFSPFGVSGVVVIQESHLAIHTWPEYRYAAVDLFTCGNSVNPWVSYKALEKAFQAEHGSAIEINRGQVELLEKSDINLLELRDQAASYLETPKFTRDVWFTERDENIAFSLRHKGDRLFKEKSPFQTVEVFDTFEYGKMLAVDGMVMCTERDEYAYHEMITHVPMLTHQNVKNVLVIGGGDGGAVRELLKYPGIEKLTMVEIDECVIRASKEFLPTLSASLTDPRLELVIDDGIKYINRAPDHTYDLVILDSSDPVGPATGLFTYDFYKDVYRCLKPDGVMVAQTESPRFNQKAFKDIYKCCRQVFGHHNVYCYLAFIPTYPSGMWSFAYCAKSDTHPINDLDCDRAKSISQAHVLKYYNDEIHVAAFSLPNFVRDMLNEQ
ncbi:MAG: polyamine aminopropyltransferase [Cyanothece sp. SIO1E1]|nr:polyamine aminopropyltransferase [Cyanothece sp. SIO1E1]